MKRYIFKILWAYIAVIFPCILQAQTTTRTITLHFNVNDFQYDYDSLGCLSICSKITSSHFLYDTNTPALPNISYDYLIGANQELQDVSFVYYDHTIINNVNMAACPEIVPTTEHCLNNCKSIPSFSNTVYPDTILYGARFNELAGFRMVHFIVCPFVYNTLTRNLSICDSVKLQIEINDIQSQYEPTDNSMRSFVSRIVMNPEEMSNLYPQPLMNPEDDGIHSTNLTTYLIITHDTLASAFQPLVDWKIKKGVPTKIVTTNEIFSLYDEPTNQLKIKRCLQEYHNSQPNLHYVLLGGDNMVVPVQKCFVPINMNSVQSKFITADIFYAYLDNVGFDWDLNNNDTIGEQADIRQKYPSLYLTRLPVQTRSQVTSFVNKILSYEQVRVADLDYETILMSGKKLFGSLTDSLKSDGQVKSERIYETSIAPYWNGNRKRLYDTYTDLEVTGTGNFTSFNLENHLKHGYPFVDVFTHGTEWYWETETSVFSYNNALSYQSKQSSIIATEACLTNAFDDSLDPCLSEAFIRNPDNGVIAYLGASCEGLTSRIKSDLGISGEYDSSFYKELFTCAENNRQFGKVVSNAKTYTFINKPKGQDYLYRWIYYGLNPIGDPEMPVFIETPKRFDSINFQLRTGDITIKTNPNNINYCAMSLQDNGESFYHYWQNRDSISIDNYPDSLSICITKPGYIPLILHVINGTVYVQNQYLNETNTFCCNGLVMGNDVQSTIPQGDVVVKTGRTTIKASDGTVIPNGFEVRNGAELIITP